MGGNVRKKQIFKTKQNVLKRNKKKLQKTKFKLFWTEWKQWKPSAKFISVFLCEHIFLNDIQWDVEMMTKKIGPNTSRAKKHFTEKKRVAEQSMNAHCTCIDCIVENCYNWLQNLQNNQQWYWFLILKRT